MDLQISLHLVIQLKIPTVWLLSQYSLPGSKCSSTFLSIKPWLNFQAHFQGYVTSIFEVNGQNDIILTFHSVLLMSWDLESCLQLYSLLLLSLAIYFLELKYVFLATLHYLFNGVSILQVKAFSNFDDAVFTLLRTILGDFDFHAIESANRFLGPIYFLSYVFFVFFVLLVST